MRVMYVPARSSSRSRSGPESGKGCHIADARLASQPLQFLSALRVLMWRSIALKPWPSPPTNNPTRSVNTTLTQHFYVLSRHDARAHLPAIAVDNPVMSVEGIGQTEAMQK